MCGTFVSGIASRSSEWTFLGQTDDLRGSDVIKFTRGVMLDFSFEVPVKLKIEFRSGEGGSSGNQGEVCVSILCILCLVDFGCLYLLFG